MERKRKVYLGESFHLKTQRLSPPSSGSLSCQTVAGDDDASSNGSGDLSWKFLDLEDNEPILTTSTGDSLDCESETPPLKARGESDKLDPRRRSMPSEAELDEFFGAAEKKIHLKFIHKYNYDIVKEKALEGRYEWE